jgi:hypothetical protein
MVVRVDMSWTYTEAIMFARTRPAWQGEDNVAEFSECGDVLLWRL